MFLSIYFLLFSTCIVSVFAGPDFDQQSWQKPGFQLDRPLYDGQETGYHVIDPKDGCNYLSYGYAGNDKNGYDFKNRGWSQLLNVDVDFYAEFSYSHATVFEYSKTRTVNVTLNSVDLSAEDKARLERERQLDAPGYEQKALEGKIKADGTDEDSDHKSVNIRDKLKLVSKRYDELKFKLKSNVEIEELLKDKLAKGERAKFYRLDGTVSA